MCYYYPPDFICACIYNIQHYLLAHISTLISISGLILLFSVHILLLFTVSEKVGSHYSYYISLLHQSLCTQLITAISCHHYLTYLTLLGGYSLRWMPISFSSLSEILHCTGTAASFSLSRLTPYHRLFFFFLSPHLVSFLLISELAGLVST